MGMVTKLIKGRDVNVRAANVEDINNDKKVTITRPINKLYPVELNNNKAEVKLKFVDEKDNFKFELVTITKNGLIKGKSI